MASSVPAIFIWLCCVSASAVASPDVPGSRDHPLVKRYPGSRIFRYQQKQFDEFDFPLGAADEKRYSKSVRVEGKLTAIIYENPENRSTLEIFRNFESALKGAGFEALYTCLYPSCGTGWTPDGTGNAFNWEEAKPRAASFKLARPEGDIYVLVRVAEDRTNLIIGEVKPMERGQVEVNAEALKSSIDLSGRALVYGVYFDTGKTELKPESEPTLKEIARLLAQNPGLRLYVVGHTDDLGSFASNLELSRGRAQAVVNALRMRHKIASDRLSANGVGPLAPVASNRTESGRTKNRRVELVEALRQSTARSLGATSAR